MAFRRIRRVPYKTNNLVRITEIQEDRNDKSEGRFCSVVGWPRRGTRSGHGGATAAATGAEGDCGSERRGEGTQVTRKCVSNLLPRVIGRRCCGDG